MTRYFSSLATGRPVELGGRSFVFEPVEPMGGSWVGVLAVDDESAASILAGAGLEITPERYDQLKKKVPGRTAPGYVPLQKPQPPPLPLAGPVVPAAASTGSSSKAAPAPAGAVTATGVADAMPDNVPLASVTLRTTTKEPPHEPLLETEKKKKRKS
jgi:hypothetical protein